MFEISEKREEGQRENRKEESADSIAFKPPEKKKEFQLAC